VPRLPSFSWVPVFRLVLPIVYWRVFFSFLRPGFSVLRMDPNGLRRPSTLVLMVGFPPTTFCAWFFTCARVLLLVLGSCVLLATPARSPRSGPKIFGALPTTVSPLRHGFRFFCTWCASCWRLLFFPPTRRVIPFGTFGLFLCVIWLGESVFFGIQDRKGI